MAPSISYAVQDYAQCKANLLNGLQCKYLHKQLCRIDNRRGPELSLKNFLTEYGSLSNSKQRENSERQRK